MDPLQLLLRKVLDAVVVMRRDGSVADWNSCAEKIFGWSRAEAIDRSMNDLIIPERYRAPHTDGLKRYLQTGSGPVMDQRIEIEAIDRNGREFPIELSITEAQYGGDQVFIGFLRDISERKAAELALRESEARLAATYNHALVGIAEVDREGRVLRANSQYGVITGYRPEELPATTIFAITHADDIEEDRRLFDEQWSGAREGYTLEKRYIRKDGTVIWIELSASMVRGGDGAASYGVRIVRDITDRKRAEEQQRLLTVELNHRVKNTLAVVQGLAHQTFKADSVPAEVLRAFEGRLSALAAAHELLVSRSWEAAPMSSVVEAALRPFESAEPQFSVVGPEVLLTPAATVNLTLAMHELATNAAKYGALSTREGRIAVDWVVRDEQLFLTWTERGGPRVSQPEATGFGSRLLERALARDLGGTVKINFEPEGVVCTIAAPLDRIRS